MRTKDNGELDVAALSLLYQPRDKEQHLTEENESNMCCSFGSRKCKKSLFGSRKRRRSESAFLLPFLLLLGSSLAFVATRSKKGR